MNATGLGCCAVTEISGLNYMNRDDPTAAADALWNYCQQRAPSAPAYPRCRYALFTEATYGAECDPQGYGHRFAKFIRDTGLGTLTDSIPEGKNPNSGNLVKVWVWIINWDALTAWIVSETTRRGYAYVQPAPPPDNWGVPAGNPAVAITWDAMNNQYLDQNGDPCPGPPPVIGPETVGPPAMGRSYVAAIDAEIQEMDTTMRHLDEQMRAVDGRSFVPPNLWNESSRLSQRLRSAARSIRPRRNP